MVDESRSQLRERETELAHARDQAAGIISPNVVLLHPPSLVGASIGWREGVRILTASCRHVPGTIAQVHAIDEDRAEAATAAAIADGKLASCEAALVEANQISEQAREGMGAAEQQVLDLTRRVMEIEAIHSNETDEEVIALTQQVAEAEGRNAWLQQAHADLCKSHQQEIDLAASQTLEMLRQQKEKHEEENRTSAGSVLEQCRQRKLQRDKGSDAEKSNLEMQLQQANDLNSASEQGFLDLTKELAEMEATVHQQAASIVELEQQLEAAKKAADAPPVAALGSAASEQGVLDLKKELAEMEATVHEQAASIVELEQQLEAASKLPVATPGTEADSSANSLADELAAARSQLEKIESASAEERAEASRQISVLSADSKLATGYGRTISLLEGEVSRLSAAAEESKSKLRERESEIFDMKEQRAASIRAAAVAPGAPSVVEPLNDQLQEVDDRIHKATQQREQSQRELIQSERRKNSELTQQLNAIEDANASLQQTNADLLAYEAVLESELGAKVKPADPAQEKSAGHSADFKDKRKLAVELAGARSKLALQVAKTGQVTTELEIIR